MKTYKLIKTGMLPTNTYVFYDDVTFDAVVVDPCYDCGKTLSYMVDHKLNLIAILLTHGHFDHCGGANTLLKYKNVDVYGSSLDAEMASTVSQNQWKARAEDCHITVFVDNLKQFTVGDFTFEVLPTPGHTQGSVCYFCQQFMFSGDTLFEGCVGRTDLKGGDSAEMFKSLQKIFKIPYDYQVLTGHENTTTLSEEKLNNPYLKMEAFDYD